ncbi:MAG: PQQ-dependent sugar dehydrogenase [Vibrio sp.]
MRQVLTLENTKNKRSIWLLSSAMLIFNLVSPFSVADEETPDPEQTAADVQTEQKAAQQTKEKLKGKLPSPELGFSLQDLKVPDGFVVEAYVTQVPNARQMSFSDDGVLVVGSREAGRVYAIRDDDKDDRHETVQEIATGLDLPSGVAFYDGDLYVAALDKILVYRDFEAQLKQPFKPKSEVFYDQLPSERHHGWKYLKVIEDKKQDTAKLIIPIGAPCNVCDKRERYSQIIAVDLASKQAELVAKGVRNSVGFDIEPQTGALWFTDNGRDMMGDDMPADELNRVDSWGQDFGFPYVHQGDTLDPEFGNGKSVADFVAPQLKLGAHVAALGMTFYQGDQFPKAYQNGIFIAEHGSWNRSTKVGYRVVFVPVKDGQLGEAQPFVTGWLQGDSVYGRPADVVVAPDGSLLISDDHKGVIYRVRWEG